MNETQEKISSINTRTVEYSGGLVDYETVGDFIDQNHNPIVVVPGYARGKVGYRGVGTGLSEQGHRAVVIVDQPHWTVSEKIKFGKMGGLSAIDHQAEALLAVLQDSKLDSRPVDFVAHSFGAVILERAAQLAQERGMDMAPFDSSKGSHSVFVGPAGSIEGDNFKKMKARFNENIKQSEANNRRGNTDHQDINDEGALYSKKNIKTIREALALGKSQISYADLGKYGLKPLVLGFPKDVVASHDLMSSNIAANSEFTSGYAMPISSPEGTHDEVVFAPQSTINSILDFLDHH